MPSVDYMGDAVLDISILPNMARNANVLGVARELSALTGRQLRKPKIEYRTEGQPVDELVSIEITEPELNPRFVIGLIRNVEIKPSPYQIQRRLRLAGTDEDLAAAAIALVGTMPAYLEAPGALESLRGRGLKLGVLSQSSAAATDSVLRFAGLRDRFELVLSAQDAGAFKPDLRPYRYALEQTQADTGNAVCMVSTHWWDVAGAKRAGLRTGWVARRERALLDTVPAPDYTGRDLAEVAEAIVTRMS